MTMRLDPVTFQPIGDTPEETKEHELRMIEREMELFRNKAKSDNIVVETENFKVTVPANYKGIIKVKPI